MSRLLLYLLFEVYGRIVPVRFARFLALPVSWLAIILRVRRHVVSINLALAFPSLSERARRSLATRAIRSVTTVFLEVPLLGHCSDRAIRRAIAFDGLERALQPHPRGTLLLSAHVGNWELLALSAGLISGRTITVVVKEQRDGGHLDRMRTSRGNRVIPTDRAVRESVRELSSGGVVAILADQSAAPPDPCVTLFGISTHAFATPAALALRYRPAVFVGFAVRQHGGVYHSVVRELVHDDLQDNDDGRVRFLQRYADTVESIVRNHPEQWLWTHRKWKHSDGVRY